VTGLLGDAFDLRFEEGVTSLVAPSPEATWELFTTAYGPTKAAADALDVDRRVEFHRAWLAFFAPFHGDGGVVHPREYLLVLGTRR
jgi:hypothetical protein